MKTTVELDETRLAHVMRLAKLKTHKATLEFALIETEKMLQLRNFAAKSFYISNAPVIDAKYDLKKMRRREK